MTHHHHHIPNCQSSVSNLELRLVVLKACVPMLVYNYTVAVLHGSCCSVVGRPAVVSCCVCQPVADPEVLVRSH